jgi:hypothetical protein
VDDATALWRKAPGEPDSIASTQRTAAATPSQCRHLPKKNYGIVENIPPDDWCIHVGPGQTLEVNAGSGPVEAYTDVPMKFEVHFRNEIVRTAIIGKGGGVRRPRNPEVQSPHLHPIRAP